MATKEKPKLGMIRRQSDKFLVDAWMVYTLSDDKKYTWHVGTGDGLGALPIFTDRDLAEKFVERTKAKHPKSGLVIVPVRIRENHGD